VKVLALVVLRISRGGVLAGLRTCRGTICSCRYLVSIEWGRDLLAPPLVSIESALTKRMKKKKHQIQSIAKIYGQANRVIVYLGQAAHDSDQALEDIYVAAEDGSTNSSISQKS
jgi:hypothetical protein